MTNKEFRVGMKAKGLMIRKRPRRDVFDVLPGENHKMFAVYYLEIFSATSLDELLEKKSHEMQKI